MNKQIEDIRFFADNLGVANYPVLDLTGCILSNALALVGLCSQAELELCAQLVKGKIMAFEQTLDGQFMVIKDNIQERQGGLFSAHRFQRKGPAARGILVELQ